MANIKADEISKILREQIANYEQTVSVDEVGSIISVGDGIARVHGLEKVMSGEMLAFPHNIFGIALNLEEEEVGVGAARRIFGIERRRHRPPHQHDYVRAGGRRTDRPRGESARRAAKTTKGPSPPKQRNPLERIAPGVLDRQPVREPLQTGIKAIDSMIPIGRGQRELIIGDRQTGKTAVILDTIINQKGSDMICIYCAHRAKTLDDCAGREDADRCRRHGLHHRRGVFRRGTRFAAIHRSLRRLRHGRIFPRQQAPRRHFLRRPFQARAGLPRNFSCCCAARRDAKRFRATCSISTRACWNAPQS